jgi:hypothetical protein
MRVLGVAQRYKKLPSEIVGVYDSYVAYCLDEACHLIMSKLDSGEEIQFNRHYTSFSELYAQYD